MILDDPAQNRGEMLKSPLPPPTQAAIGPKPRLVAPRKTEWPMESQPDSGPVFEGPLPQPNPFGPVGMQNLR
jgi:hypothetical protein